MAFEIIHPEGVFTKESILNYSGKNYSLNFCKAWYSSQENYWFKSSGSTGKPKEIQLNRKNLEWSAKASRQAFQLQGLPKILLALQAEVIGGSMLLVRAMVWDCPIKVLEAKAHPLEEIEENHDFSFLSLVPYQLQTILKNPNSISKLNRFELLLLGGASLDNSLQLEINNKLTIKVLHSYGMTETSSHVALRELHPSYEKAFTPLPGVSVSINENGCLEIISPSAHNSPLRTNDLAEIDSDNRFVILGRADLVVNSGGIKISIDEIEALSNHILSNKGIFLSFIYWKKPDAQLGERLIMLIEGNVHRYQEEEILAYLKKELPPYKAPKEIIFVGSFTRSASGKILREESLGNHGKK